MGASWVATPRTGGGGEGSEEWASGLLGRQDGDRPGKDLVKESIF